MAGIQQCDSHLIHWITVALIVGSVLGCEEITSSQTVEAQSGRSVALQIQDIQNGQSHELIAAVPFVADDWKAIRGLKGLQTLILAVGTAHDSDMEVITTLPDIQRLVLRHSPLSDSGMKTLSRCTTLRNLNVPQVSCSILGIRSMESLPHLEHLRIGGSSLDGSEVCRAVVRFSHLKTLHLIDIAIGDEGLNTLAGRPDLWSLYLDGAEASDAAWERYFEACPQVHVHINQSHHDRDPLKEHDQ